MSSKRPDKRTIMVRVVCIALAAIMVLGMGVYIFMLIGGKM